MRPFSTPFLTLARREIMRFLSVFTQTLVTPMITAVLYMFIFGYSWGGQIRKIEGFTYIQFLIPGLIMMGVMNNAYQNAASSLFISKYFKNIQDVLVAPIRNSEIIAAFIFGALLRGLMVGSILYIVSLFFTHVPVHNVAWIAAFSILAAVCFGLFGMIVGIIATQFEGLSIINTFVMLPLTYLGGVFYSVDILPPAFQKAMLFNPFFYMITGLRYGFLGISDASPWLCISVVAGVAAVLFAGCSALLQSGYRLRT